MEALRAAIAAAQSAGTLLLATFRPYREKDFVWKRLSELEDFSKICDRIELDPVLGRDCDIEANLKRCADNVSDLKVLLEEATSFDQDHRFRGSWKSLVGEDIDEEFVRLFNRLQRERAALELRIENATSYAEYQMGVAAREAKPRAAASSANWLRSAIFITDPRNDRSALISAKGKRADGTCTWILETDAYSTWMHTPCPGLWITGGPGIGKSIMSIFLTEQLELKVEGPTKESVIYFFCDGQNDARDNAPAILQALIWQLGRLKPYLIQHAIPQVQSHFGMKVYSTRIESLCRTFISMVEDPDAGCVFCVIDGLDECDSTSSELVNCLLGVTTPRFKPIIISRPLNQSLTSSLSEYVRLRLDTDFEKQVKTDLSAFIQQRVQQLSDDGDFLPALRHVLHDKFMKRSEGTFLWVGLAAQELENTQLAEVETSLSSLPSGLNGIYNQVLRSIDPACATSVARLLTVVMTAYIPLSIEDAESLLGIQPTDDLTASEVMESLIAQCGSLLTLLGEPKSRKRVIRLVHQSVKDYLFRPSKDADHELEAFRFQQQKAHLQLASLCLDILESFKFREGRPEDIQKFRETGFRAQYALDCFENHAKDSGSEFSSLVLRSLPFLKPLIYASDEDDKTDWGCLMHNASQFGILPVVRHALDKPLGLYKSVRGYTRGTTPLHIAALSEYGETVRALLQKQRYLPGKWSVSAKDWAGETPLHVAAVRSPTSSVQALLDYKANPNLPNCQGHTALHKAVYSDHSEIVRLLLSAGAQVSAQDLCGRTPLFLAAAIDLIHGAHGDGFCQPDTDPVLKQLLEAGSDVNRGDEYGITPLHIAVRRHSVRHTRLLLHWGANHNVANYWGFKPLHYIAGGHEITTFDEYRARDRSPNSKRADWFVPNEPNPKFVNANLPNSTYYVSKAWGDARGQLETGTKYIFIEMERVVIEMRDIVDCFKSRGADLNVQAADGTTPLMCCMYRNNMESVIAAACLLKAGVDVDTQDDHGNSCLHLAVVQRKRRLVSLLIDYGADQELQNKKGVTPADLIQLRPEFWEVLETEVKVEEVE